MSAKHTFALRSEFIFLTLCSDISPGLFSNYVYIANLENHCIYILVELQRYQSFRYFVTGIEFWVETGYKLACFLVFAGRYICR